MVKKRIFDERLFEIADDIASEHTKQGWFESHSAALARLIRLRSDIYNALMRKQENRHGNG